MLSRFAAVWVAIGLLACGALAQEGPPPEQEGPPPSTLPPPPPNQPPPRIEARPPPAAPRGGERCGAVAYTADGAFGAAYGMEDCNDAERLAVDECRREAVDKDDCSRGVVTRRDSWFHIQFCRRGDDWTTHITTKPSFAETNRDAADWAQKSQYGSTNCRLVPNGMFHSGGMHTKM